MGRGERQEPGAECGYSGGRGKSPMLSVRVSPHRLCSRPWNPLGSLSTHSETRIALERTDNNSDKFNFKLYLVEINIKIRKKQEIERKCFKMDIQLQTIRFNIY